MTLGEPPWKSRSLTVACVTLQRVPPLIRIFRPDARVRVQQRDARSGLCGTQCRGDTGGAGTGDEDVARGHRRTVAGLADGLQQLSLDTRNTLR